MEFNENREYMVQQFVVRLYQKDFLGIRSQPGKAWGDNVSYLCTSCVHCLGNLAMCLFQCHSHRDADLAPGLLALENMIQMLLQNFEYGGKSFSLGCSLVSHRAQWAGGEEIHM